MFSVHFWFSPLILWSLGELSLLVHEATKSLGAPYCLMDRCGRTRPGHICAAVTPLGAARCRAQGLGFSSLVSVT